MATDPFQQCVSPVNMLWATKIPFQDSKMLLPAWSSPISSPVLLGTRTEKYVLNQDHRSRFFYLCWFLGPLFHGAFFHADTIKSYNQPLPPAIYHCQFLCSITICKLGGLIPILRPADCLIANQVRFKSMHNCTNWYDKDAVCIGVDGAVIQPSKAGRIEDALAGVTSAMASSSTTHDSVRWVTG